MAITQRRTMQDFAHQMRWLVDEAYPDVPVRGVEKVISGGEFAAGLEDWGP